VKEEGRLGVKSAIAREGREYGLFLQLRQNSRVATGPQLPCHPDASFVSTGCGGICELSGKRPGRQSGLVEDLASLSLPKTKKRRKKTG
jgi:hypothetical protein